LINTPDQKIEIRCGSYQEDIIESNDTFETLFNQYFKPLCFFCQYKFGFDNDAAKDIVHSAYMRLFESQLSFISGASAKAYLYKLTAGICIDLLRRESVKQRYVRSLYQTSSQIGSTQDETSVELKQLQNDLHNAIENFPTQMRQVFELSRNEGLRYSEIAQALGLSIKTVETQMSRALTKLRKKLASYLS
jgi:RNA polymerase sigma-70 factor (ECF subfamily)